VNIPADAATGKLKSGSSVLRKLRSKRTGLLFIAPTFVLILSVTIFPLLYSIRMTFSRYFLTQGAPPEFIGLQNWFDVFGDPKFWNSMAITARVVIPALVLQFLLGLGLALLLNRKLRGRGLIISLLATPVMIAPVAAGLSFRLLYSPNYGPINAMISRIAGRVVEIDWLGTVDWSVRAITAVDVWQQTPFIMLVLLAGLSNVPRDVYEAALIDGANAAQVFARITLPLIRPVITVALLIRGIDLLKFFDLVFVLTMGGPAGSTETVSFYAYLVGIRFFRVGYGATISYVVLAVAIVLSGTLIRLMRQREVAG
jgi:multiple sugar transport system permease protein